MPVVGLMKVGLATKWDDAAAVEHWFVRERFGLDLLEIRCFEKFRPLEQIAAIGEKRGLVFKKKKRGLE